MEKFESSFSLCSFVLLSSLFVASALAFLERDFKKLVAFRTIRQISFVGFLFSLSCFSLAIFHIVLHAFFKSLIFMRVGNLIHQSGGSQHFNSLSSSSPLSCSVLLFCALNLGGVGFFSGLFRKDLSLEVFEGAGSCLFLLTIYFRVFLTFLYCLKVSFSLFGPTLSKETSSFLLPLSAVVLVGGSGLRRGLDLSPLYFLCRMKLGGVVFVSLSVFILFFSFLAPLPPIKEVLKFLYRGFSFSLSFEFKDSFLKTFLSVLSLSNIGPFFFLLFALFFI